MKYAKSTRCMLPALLTVVFACAMLSCISASIVVTTFNRCPLCFIFFLWGYELGLFVVCVSFLLLTAMSSLLCFIAVLRVFFFTVMFHLSGRWPYADGSILVIWSRIEIKGAVNSPPAIIFFLLTIWFLCCRSSVFVCRLLQLSYCVILCFASLTLFAHREECASWLCPQ